MSESHTKETPRSKIVSGNWTQGTRSSTMYKTNSGSLFLSGRGGGTSITAKREAPLPQLKGWTASAPRIKRQSSILTSSQRDKSLDISKTESSQPRSSSVTSHKNTLSMSLTVETSLSQQEVKTQNQTSVTPVETKSSTTTLSTSLSSSASSVSSTTSSKTSTPTTLSIPTPPTNVISQSSSSTPSSALAQTPTNENKLLISTEDGKGGNANDLVHVKMLDDDNQSIRNRVGSGPTIVQPQPRVATIAVTSTKRKQKIQQKRFSENSGGLHMFTTPQFTNIANSTVESENNSTEVSSSTMSPVFSPLNTNINACQSEDDVNKVEKTGETENEGGQELQKPEEIEDNKYKVQPIDPNVPQNKFPVPTLATDLFSYPKTSVDNEEDQASISESYDVFGVLKPRKVELGDTKYEAADFVVDGTSLPSLEFMFGTKDSYGNEIDARTLMMGSEEHETLTSDTLISSGITFNTKSTNFSLDVAKYNKVSEISAKKKHKYATMRLNKQLNKTKEKDEDETSPRKKDTSKVPEEISIIPDAEICRPNKAAELLVGTFDGVEQARELEVTHDDLNEKNVIKICVCGTGKSGRGLWITRLLGYSNMNIPNFNYLSKKVKINGVVNNILFTLCNTDEDVSASIKYRWADAFILTFSASDRKSYDSIPNIYQEIVKDNGGRHKPAMIAMNVTNNYRNKSTWCVTEQEQIMLSESLNTKLFKCDTSISVINSFKFLCISHKSRRAVVAMKSQGPSPKMAGFKLPMPSEDRLSPLHSSKMERSANARLCPTTKITYEFVVLGDSFTGKTTFIKKFLGGPFDKNYIATMNVLNKRRVMTLNGSKNECTIKLIDTPGPFFFDQNTAIELEDPIDNLVEITINWLKRRSLLHANGYIIMFSYISSDSFEYACKLLKALKSVPTEAHKGPLSGYLIGTKTDLKYTCTVSHTAADSYAKVLKSGLSSLSLKDISRNDMTLLMNKIVAQFTGHSQEPTNIARKKSYYVRLS